MPAGFINILILMAIAVATVWLFKRIHLPPILAYLVVGVLVGADLLALFEHPEAMHVFAELGIVFLLFSLGLEFSLPKMLAMRHLVFGVGLGQMIFTTGIFMLLGLLFGMDSKAALIVGGMAALSSTAIVIKQVGELGILNTTRSQMAVSILLFQDLAVVPLLIVIPLLAEQSTDSLALGIAMAILKGSVVVVLLMSAGKWILPRVFSEIARTRTDELFMLTSILVALIAAGLTYAFGLSMALGAFLAGMMLGESQYRHQLEADIRPFRDILMGLFFITVGMQLDLAVLSSQLHWALLLLVLLLVTKVLLIRLSAWLFRAAKTDAWSAGVKLCQMGEFSFVIATLALDHGILSSEQVSLLVSVGLMSMAVTPYLVDKSLDIAKWLVNEPLPAAEPGNLLEALHHKRRNGHVVIFGFGRVGQSVARLLTMEGIYYVAVDADPFRVQEARGAGEPVFFGDVTQTDILRQIGIEDAKLALLTFDQPTRAIKVVKAVASVNDKLPIVVRTRKDNYLEQLYDAGASQVVPEILEGSLMLVSQVLHYSGVPMSRILKRVRSERKAHYDHMHGFFPGETTEITYSRRDKMQFHHPVALTPNAYSVGKSLAELDFAKMRISLLALRRDNKEIMQPDHQQPLKVGDTLVIAGKPRRVERAERYLLYGTS